MKLTRRTALKLGVGAGALPLLGRSPLAARQDAPTPVAPAPNDIVQARPVPLSAVRLTGGPLKRAQDLNARYLLELEPDRMLAYYRDRAGLTPKAEGYGGWDGDGRNLTGHIAGHYLMAASFFWDRVVQYHTFSSGGHGKDEYFGPPGQLSERIDGRTAETCNIYNMLKLTRQLFSLRPDAHYADFHERALFNHIMASIDPEDGRTCYMVPVGRGVQREYQNMSRSFTCCVGSGMESHALHGDGIYYEAGDRLWVNLYAPSTADWSDAGVRLQVETGFPEWETATLRVETRAPREFALMLRQPFWAGEGFSVRVNGRPVAPDAEPEGLEFTGRSQYGRLSYEASSFRELRRTWQSGDVVEVALPKSLRLEALPDNPRRASIMWGPLVLAGDLGAEDAVTQRMLGRPGRRGGSWFSFDIPVAADHPMTLIATYYSDDRRGTPASFEILIDGIGVAEAEVDRSEPPRFFDVEYPIPARLVEGKESVTVRLQAKPDSQIATVFGLRMVRADELR